MRILAFVSCLFLTNPAMADDLQTAVRSALSTHPAIEAARQGVEAALQEVNIERSSLFPVLSLSATAGRVYGDNSTSRGLVVTRGSGYSWLGEASASLNQTLYDWSSRDKRVDRAGILQENARTLMLDVKDATAFRAVQSYVAVSSARAAMDLIVEQKIQMEGLVERLTTAVEEGGGDEAELSQAMDLMLLADNAFANAMAREATANANYREAVGVDAPEDMNKPGIPEGGMPDNITRAVTAGLEDHPQLLSARTVHQSYDLEEESEIAAALPRLDGQLSYLKRDQRDEIGGEVVDARATLSMNWDIETGGAALSRSARLKALSEQARSEEQELTLSLERDIRTAWAAHDLAHRQVDIQARRVSSAQSVMDTYESQFEAAQRSLLDLMRAKVQLYEARLAYLDADYARIDSGFTVLAAMGDLREALNVAN